MLLHQKDHTRDGKKHGHMNTAFVSSYRRHLKLKLPQLSEADSFMEQPPFKYNKKCLKSIQ
jgi:hypothetical protein